MHRGSGDVFGHVDMVLLLIMRTARGLSRRSPSSSLYPTSIPLNISPIRYGRCTRCGEPENVLEFVRKWPLTRDIRDTNLLLQPGSLSLAKCRKRVRQFLFFVY
jgi:hypothetical protein